MATTKLELLGMMSSLLDCADYLRGRHFIVECDYMALLQKKMKRSIYTGLQFCNNFFWIQCINQPHKLQSVGVKQNQETMYQVQMKMIFIFNINAGVIKLPSSQNKTELFHIVNGDTDSDRIQNRAPVLMDDDGYDGDKSHLDICPTSPNM